MATEGQCVLGTELSRVCLTTCSALFALQRIHHVSRSSAAYTVTMHKDRNPGHGVLYLNLEGGVGKTIYRTTLNYLTDDPFGWIWMDHHLFWTDGVVQHLAS